MVDNQDIDTNESSVVAPKKKKKKFNIFNPFRNSYQQIKTNGEIKNRSVKFGLLAILFCFICIGLCYPCIWVGVKGIEFAFTHYFGPLTWLFGIGNLTVAALSLGVALLPYYFWFQGIWLVIYQFCMNRRLISWLALLVWLVSVVGIFLFSIETFAHFVGIGTVWLYK